MNAENALTGDATLRRYEYDDDVVFAGDLGPERRATVDVVDDTAIVVADGEQYDLDLPAGDAKAFIHNGVLTIEVRDDPEEIEE